MEVTGRGAGSSHRPPADRPSARALAPRRPSSPLKKHCRVVIGSGSAPPVPRQWRSRRNPPMKFELAVSRGAGTDIEWQAASGRLTRKSWLCGSTCGCLSSVAQVSAMISSIGVDDVAGVTEEAGLSTAPVPQRGQWNVPPPPPAALAVALCQKAPSASREQNEYDSAS